MRHRLRDPRVLVSAILLAVFFVVAAIWLIRTSASSSGARASGQAATQTVDAGGEPAGRPKTVSPTPSPSSLATRLPDEGCPTPGGAATAQFVLIRVAYWCIGEVLTDDAQVRADQVQVKVRLIITNSSDGTVGISVANPSRIRLIVEGANMRSRWRPRSKTLSGGDTPVPVILEGRSYWAIPPNANYDEKGLASVGLYTGFASKWEGPETLVPGQTIGGTKIGDGSSTYNGPDAKSNLVFEVPVELGLTPDVVGVAVLAIPEGAGPADWTVIGLCRQTDWGPRLAPAYF